MFTTITKGVTTVLKFAGDVIERAIEYGRKFWDQFTQTEVYHELSKALKTPVGRILGVAAWFTGVVAMGYLALWVLSFAFWVGQYILFPFAVLSVLVVLTCSVWDVVSQPQPV